MTPDMVLRKAVIAARSYRAPAKVVQPMAVVVEPEPIVALPPTEPGPTPPAALHVIWYEETEDSRPVTMAKIVGAVSAATAVSARDIISARRTAPIVLARQIAMYLCRVLTLQSYPAIGRYLGGRDHSTVWHGIHKVEDRITADPEFAARIAAIRESIAS